MRDKNPLPPRSDNIKYILDYWAQWKLTPLWQQHILDLFRKNDEQNIVPFIGDEPLPDGMSLENYKRDISLAVLIFLYIEIPYQMGLYEFMKYCKKIDKKGTKPRDPYSRISSNFKEENFLFIKMQGKTGFRNFIMKYLAFFTYMLKIDFPSEYKRNQWVYSLMQAVLPKELKGFGITKVQIEDIKAALHNIDERFTENQCEGLDQIFYGTVDLYDNILYGLYYEEPNPRFTADNLPIYSYLDECDRMDYCLNLICAYHGALYPDPKCLIGEDGMIPWKDYIDDSKIRRYFT